MAAAETTHTATFAHGVRADLVALAAPIVAHHLAISLPEAEAQLRQGRVLIASQTAAARLLPLLRALGLPSEVVSGRAVTLALQVTDLDSAARLAPALAHVLAQPMATILKDLHRSGGLQLAEMTEGDAADLRLKLRTLRGLRVTQAEGLFDVFSQTTVAPATRRALSRHLAMMGFAPCKFSGALAFGLTAIQAAKLRTRFGDAGLLTINRAFQRYDLFLTGTDGMAAADAAEFLSTRVDLSGMMLETVTPLQPLQIERGLSRKAARQFQADYSTIGLQTCARLAEF